MAVFTGWTVSCYKQIAVQGILTAFTHALNNQSLDLRA